jgi:HEAT repeat protein
MDAMNRLLAWAAYLVCGVAIGVACYAAFDYYRRPRPNPGTDVTSQNGENEGDTFGEDEVLRGSHVEQIFAQRAQIKRLQTLLTQKTTLLERKTALLEEKTAEQETLRTELDQAIELLQLLMADTTTGSGQAVELTDDERRLQSELDQLRNESEEGRTLAEQQQAEFDLLMMELAATDEKIAQLERESEQELIQLTADRQAFETVVASTVARIGEAAVPVLIEQLRHPNADVRLWAATVLGQIGPAARDAIPPLLEMLADAEPGVRNAARRSLESIDPTGR